jgi:hypothetical protein
MNIQRHQNGLTHTHKKKSSLDIGRRILLRSATYSSMRFRRKSPEYVSPTLEPKRTTPTYSCLPVSCCSPKKKNFLPPLTPITDKYIANVDLQFHTGKNTQPVIILKGGLDRHFPLNKTMKPASCRLLPPMRRRLIARHTVQLLSLTDGMNHLVIIHDARSEFYLTCVEFVFVCCERKKKCQSCQPHP